MTYKSKVLILLQIAAKGRHTTRCLKVRKSLIQHYEQSELRVQFEWTKVDLKCQKWSIFAIFK